MPKTTIDYLKLVIYKIVCNDLNVKDVYIGSTTNFIKRKTSHKNATMNEKHPKHNAKKYQFIKNNGGWDNFTMLEIEKYPCVDGNEARLRERYWFEQLQATLNTYTPIITKEEDIQRRKELNDKNRAVYNQNRRDKEVIMCGCGGRYKRNWQKAVHDNSKRHQRYILNQQQD
jgi:hypothetical protein